jgi:phosphoglycerate dehydrogenase-like enzyme
MKVHVANRSAVPVSDLVDRAFTLDRLARFLGLGRLHRRLRAVDSETKGIVDAAAFAAMKPTPSSSMSGAARPSTRQLCSRR